MLIIFFYINFSVHGYIFFKRIFEDLCKIKFSSSPLKFNTNDYKFENSIFSECNYLNNTSQIIINSFKKNLNFNINKNYTTKEENLTLFKNENIGINLFKKKENQIIKIKNKNCNFLKTNIFENDIFKKKKVHIKQFCTQIVKKKDLIYNIKLSNILSKDVFYYKKIYKNVFKI